VLQAYLFLPNVSGRRAASVTGGEVDESRVLGVDGSEGEILATLAFFVAVHRQVQSVYRQWKNREIYILTMSVRVFSVTSVFLLTYLTDFYD
jgi:hypothetical protein